jgi:hypothetical protein
MFIIPLVVTCTLNVPAGYVSRIHHRAQDATAVCGEIPHPDDDYLPCSHFVRRTATNRTTRGRCPATEMHARQLKKLSGALMLRAWPT